jgi:Putative transposase
VRLSDDRVTFTYKDYAEGCRQKELTLSAVEFIRRFALHVVPGGLVRIRQYGLLSNRGRHQRLARCRELLGVPAAAQAEPVGVEPSATLRTPTPAGSWLAVLLPLLLAGLPPLPPTAEPAVPAEGPRCLDCGIGRLQTLWQAPRARSRELPSLSSWRQGSGPRDVPDSS